MTDQITLDELVSELDKLEAQNSKSSDGFTSEELRDAWSMGKDRVGQRLRILHRAGMLVVGRRTMTDIAGRVASVPVYKVKVKSGRKGKG